MTGGGVLTFISSKSASIVVVFVSLPLFAASILSVLMRGLPDTLRQTGNRKSQCDLLRDAMGVFNCRKILWQ